VDSYTLNNPPVKNNRVSHCYL